MVKRVFSNILVGCLAICFLMPEINVLAIDGNAIVNPAVTIAEGPEVSQEEINESEEDIQEVTITPAPEVTGLPAILMKEESLGGEVSTIEGQVLLAILFTPEEAELYKAALADTLREVQEDVKNEIYACEDEDRKDFFSNQLELLQEIEINEMFKEQTNGNLELRIPHRNAEIIVGDEEYLTDDEGYYKIEDEANIESIFEGENKVILADQNVEFAELEVSFDENVDNNEIKHKKTFLEFAEGAVNMGEKMQQAEGQTVQVFYPKKNKQQALGAGAGVTTVYKDTNIVGCNKHDKNLNPINAVQFATGNSDCAKSIRLGVIVSSSTKLPLYPYSVYCVEEAASEGNVENIYCNGKSNMRDGTSKKGHINCSWFDGIGHSEAFHTHDEKGTAPTTSIGSWNTTNHNAESKTISLMSSSKWEIESASVPAWLSVSSKSGKLGTSQVTIKATKNTTAAKRTGSISIKNSYGTKKFKVTQPFNPALMLTLSSNEWKPTYKAQKTTVTITTNQKSWSATETVDWLSLTKAGNELTIKATENKGTAARTAKITVKAGSVSKTITVTQGGPTLTLSKSTWNPTYKKSSVNVTITTNQAKWEATEKATWLTMTKSGNKLTIKATENTGTKSRTADVTVKVRGLSKTITVTQGGPTLTLSKSTWNPTYKKSSVNVTITTNQEKWEATEKVAWLSMTKSGNKLTINATENTGTADRSATVTVKVRGLSQNITVRQGRRTLTVSKTEWKPTYGAQSTVITIVTNQGDWSATESVSWLTMTKAGDKLTIKAMANTGKASRQATVTVKAGTLTRYIVVEQNKK